MGKLGTFGQSHQAVEDETFDYLGTEFRLHPEFAEGAFVDWIEEHGSLEETDVRAQTAIKRLMRAVVHTEDFDRFWSLSRQHRQSSEDHLKLVQGLVEATTGRPTGASADSSAGRSDMPANSAADFSERAKRRLEEKGRPDLAVAIVRREQAQAASTA